MKRYSALLAVPLAAMFLIAGCGGSDDSSDSNTTASTGTTTQTEKPAETTGNSGPATTVALAADPSGALAYEEDTLKAKAGTVDVDFTNDASIAHDVVFEQDGNEVGRSSVITGDSETVPLKLKAGEYTYYCSLPGHEAGGMKGVLTVK